MVHSTPAHHVSLHSLFHNHYLVWSSWCTPQWPTLCYCTPCTITIILWDVHDAHCNSTPCVTVLHVQRHPTQRTTVPAMHQTPRAHRAVHGGCDQPSSIAAERLQHQHRGRVNFRTTHCHDGGWGCLWSAIVHPCWISATPALGRVSFRITHNHTCREVGMETQRAGLEVEGGWGGGGGGGRGKGLEEETQWEGGHRWSETTTTKQTGRQNG